MRSRRIVVLLGSVGVVSATVVVASTGAGVTTASVTTTPVLPACTGQPSTVQEFPVGSGTAPGAYGYFALPASGPTGIVAVAHGYQQTALSMSSYLTELATDDNVIAFAVDNTGTQDNSNGTSSRGWDVVQGAADIESTALAIDAQCKPAGSAPFVDSLVGISMGGDTSGIVAAAGTERPDGTPLFDYWFDVSGVTNLTETYTEATLYSPLSAYAAQAKADIEAEMGGTPAQFLPRYVAASPVTLAGAMKHGGIKGVDVFHAVLDGLVTSDEGTQMVAALQANGVPTNFFTAVFQSPGAQTTTLDGDLIGALIPGYSSPFAGHVGGVIWATARAKISALYNHQKAPEGLSVTLSDGQLGTVPLASVPGG
ncbi:MAG: alpha/beta hydrolase family protein [Acidimicrobiales bacterium]